jgi:amino acid transporter
MLTESHYIRGTSGLVKEFRLLDVFIFNVLGYGLGLVLAVTPTFLGNLYPSADIYLVLMVGVVLSISNGLTYGLFAAAMPRSGGDYVFIGRTLSPWLGFTANWGFTWSQLIGLGVFAGWASSDSLIPSLSTFGHIAGYPAIVDLAKSLSAPTPKLVIGTVLLLFVLLVSVLGFRVLRRMLLAIFVVAVAGTLAMYGSFLMVDHAEFVQRFNAFMAESTGMANAYQEILNLAQSKGLELEKPTSIWSAVAAIPIGYWVFIGFTYSAYVGGEIREPQRSQTWGILGALLFGFIVYMLVMGQYYSVVGRDLNNAVALLNAAGQSPLPAGTSMVFFAGICTDSLFVNLLMGLSSFLWFSTLLFIMAQISIRNIFAWSFDRLMPSWLTKVTRGRSAPWAASLVVVGLGEVFLILHCLQLTGIVNYISMYSLCFLICGVAAVVFPYRKRRMFDSSPSIVQKRVLGIPLISIVGAISVLLFSLVLYSALTNPGISGVSGYLPTLVTASVYAAGAIVYFSVPYVRRLFGFTDGVPPEVLFEELPPD